jgi:hypothetical protein
MGCEPHRSLSLQTTSTAFFRDSDLESSTGSDLDIDKESIFNPISCSSRSTTGSDIDIDTESGHAIASAASEPCKGAEKSQEAHEVAKAATVPITSPAIRMLWLLKLRIDDMHFGPNLANTTVYMRVEYGDKKRSEALDTNMVRCTPRRSARDPVVLASFRKTCLFTWDRSFRPVFRLTLKKGNFFVDSTLSQTTVDIPFCEDQNGGANGWIERPGTLERDVAFRDRFTRKAVGRVRVSMELSGIPWSKLKLHFGADTFNCSPRIL